MVARHLEIQEMIEDIQEHLNLETPMEDLQKDKNRIVVVDRMLIGEDMVIEEDSLIAGTMEAPIKEIEVVHGLKEVLIDLVILVLHQDVVVVAEGVVMVEEAVGVVGQDVEDQRSRLWVNWIRFNSWFEVVETCLMKHVCKSSILL